MDSIALRHSGSAAVSVADPEPVLVGAWLLTKRSLNTRSGYATDVGYRYSEAGGGQQLVRSPSGRGWCDFLDRAQVPLLAADEVHVLLWMRELRSTGWAEVTVARKVAAVSSLYAYLVRRKVLTVNPAECVDRPAVDPDESATQGPDREQALMILTWTRQHASARDHALIAVLLFAGLRVSEAVRADVSDLGQARGHRTLRVVRKGGKTSTVVLTKTAWAALTRYLGDRADGPLFLSRGGVRLTRQRASMTVRSLCTRSGASDSFTAHSLRHGFATLSLDAGVTLTDLQDAMGHADPRTTRRYDRARNRIDRHPGHKLEEFLAG